MSREYLFGVDEEKLDQFRAVMDIRTYEMLVELLSRDDEYGGCIPWPYVKLESVLLNEGVAGWLAKIYGKGIKDVYLGYDSSCIRSYSEYDRVLCYVIYGYGNLSNNDRKRSGLRTRRFRDR